jgi:Tfp pilus assembly protein PilN
MVKLNAEQALRKNGRQADPNTPMYLGITLVVLFCAVVGYVMYVNQKLKEAGLLDRKPKHLSKKKLEKERAKAQRKTK